MDAGVELLFAFSLYRTAQNFLSIYRRPTHAKRCRNAVLVWK